MEELIGIIVAVAVLIFKVVAKRMNDSADKPVRPAARPLYPEQGQPESVRQYETFEEVFPGLDYDYVIEVPKVKPVEVPKEKAPAPTKRNAPPVKMQKEASESPDKKEKIDPKKLVVYSEIMNRKY